MDSIADNIAARKCGLTPDKGGVYMGESGIELKRHGQMRRAVNSGGKRGAIDGFSAAARRRLRQSLLRARLRETGYICGVTLTLPWSVADGAWMAYMDKFRDSWDSYCHAWRRKYPHSAMIYRVELQQRGAPHIHAVCYMAAADGSVDNLKASLTGLWAQAMGNRVRWTDGAINGGYAHRGVSVDHIKSMGAIMRYLCDHATKRKQAQLGYKGKQWGVVARANLDWLEPTPIELEPRAEVLFRRCLRRLCRYTLNKGNHALAPFGRHKGKGRGGNGIRYGVSPDTARRIADWAINQAKEEQAMAQAMATETEDDDYTPPPCHELGYCVADACPRWEECRTCGKLLPPED